MWWSARSWNISAVKTRPSRNTRSCYARLKRNLSSKQGRVDYIRVKLHHEKDTLSAEPVLGKSGLIHTMVKADGLVRIDKNTEGLDKGTIVEVALLDIISLVKK